MIEESMRRGGASLGPMEDIVAVSIGIKQPVLPRPCPYFHGHSLVGGLWQVSVGHKNTAKCSWVFLAHRKVTSPSQP